MRCELNKKYNSILCYVNMKKVDKKHTIRYDPTQCLAPYNNNFYQAPYCLWQQQWKPHSLSNMTNFGKFLTI